MQFGFEEQQDGILVDSSVIRPTSMPLSFALGGCSQKILEQKPLIRFKAWNRAYEDSALAGLWNITAQPYAQDGSPLYHLGSEAELRFLFSNVATEEKERIFSGFRDDMIYNQMYGRPASEQRHWLNALPYDELPASTGQVNMVHTLPIVLPDRHMAENGKLSRNARKRLTHDLREISHSPDLDPQVRYVLEDYMAENGHEIVASQFLAMRYTVHLDHELSQIHLVRPEQFNGMHPMAQEMENSRTGGWFQMVDFWRVHVVQPHDINPLFWIQDLRSVNSFLDEAEKICIAPQYYRDPELMQLHDNFKDLGGFQPNHYSRLKLHQWFADLMPPYPDLR